MNEKEEMEMSKKGPRDKHKTHSDFQATDPDSEEEESKVFQEVIILSNQPINSSGANTWRRTGPA